MHMLLICYFGIQGSVIRCQLDEESQRATEDARQLLKSQLRLGWSSEAVKQGVAHAKKGEYDAALGCYKKVSMCRQVCPQLFLCLTSSFEVHLTLTLILKLIKVGLDEVNLITWPVSHAAYINPTVACMISR